MDYSQLSDFEINKRVAIALGLEVKDWPEADRPYILHVVKNELGNDYFDDTDYKDYCNNASDAWPIILKNGINVFTDMIPHGLLGQARASVISHEPPNSECIIAEDANPLRAAMIVFLMMQDSKHA